MNLFLCYTPLQLVIASRVIELQRMDKNDVEVFFISKVDSLVVRNTLLELKEYCHKIHFVHMKRKYPLYFLRVFLMFFRRKFDAVYVASIDNVIMHFILSHIKFSVLYSFDDGTANIFPDSMYYQAEKKCITRSLLRLMLGIRVSMQEVKMLSQQHFTIYPGFKNVIDNVHCMSLQSEYKSLTCSSSSIATPMHEACNVMLGSVYSFLFESGVDYPSLLHRCVHYFKENGNPCFYIPHPRQLDESFFSDVEYLKPEFIAEREVLNLLATYKCVHLYGFMSSCQFNLASDSRIINHVFHSDTLVPAFKNISENGLLPPGFDVIDIDCL